MEENNEPKKRVGTFLRWESNMMKGIKQYLTFINPIIKNKLSPMEIDTLASYIYLDNYYKTIPKEVRNTILFSKEMRKKIVKYLDTSNDAYNNIISSLYKKGYLSKDGKINVQVPIDDNNEIKISLTIKLLEAKEPGLHE